MSLQILRLKRHLKQIETSDFWRETLSIKNTKYHITNIGHRVSIRFATLYIGLIFLNGRGEYGLPTSNYDAKSNHYSLERNVMALKVQVLGPKLY